MVHFNIQDVNGNKIATEDVVEIECDELLVKRVIDGFEFEEENADEVSFTVTVRPEYEECYKLVSVGDVPVETDSKSVSVDASNMDEQDILIVLEACEYEVSAQVNVGGVTYELADVQGKYIDEDGRKVRYGENFAFKLKNGSRFYNDSVDVIVTEKSGDVIYTAIPNKSNIYTLEGELFRGDTKISREIAKSYGNVKYTGGLCRGDWEIALSAENVSLVSVPVKAGEEPNKYNVLSVPEGNYKLELEGEMAEKYMLADPDKIYKVIRDKTTYIDAAIEPRDDLNRYNIYFESDLKVVKVSTIGNPVYAEMNDDAELAYKSIEAGDDYKKFSVYDTSDEIALDISVDEAFKEKYEIKSVKYKGTEEAVTKNPGSGYYILQQKEGSEATEIEVVVGTIVPAVTGEFSVEINSYSKKYIEIDSIKASKDNSTEKLTINEDGTCQIPDGTNHIYIDVKSNDIDRVPLENIVCKINGEDSVAATADYKFNDNTVHMAFDTASLAGKSVEFFVKVNSLIVFDDNVMIPTIENHSINIVHDNDACYREAVSGLDYYGVNGFKENLYVYSFTDSKSLNIGEELSFRIAGRDSDYYRRDYTGKNNITYYYQIFGDKLDTKHKITNPDEFHITLDQANSIIVFTYEVNMVDRVFVGDGESFNEVFDLTVNLDRNSQVKIMSTGMSSNLSRINVKDPSTATWKISTLTQAKSDELLKIEKDDAVYFEVNDVAIKALGYKQFAIERTENGKKTAWNFVINSEKPEVTVKNLDNKTIYAGQEKSFEYEIKGSNCVLTKDNIRIYKANGDLSDAANIDVKSVSANNITIMVSAVNAASDKATYYIDVVNANGESLLKGGKKLKLNVAVLDSKFNVKNIEYVRSDEDNIYFRVKGLSAEAESLYTSIIVSAKAIVAEGNTLNAFYKSETVIKETFKNDMVIKVPVKANPDDTRDDKSTSQDYSFTFRLQQKKSDESGVYKYAEAKLGNSFSNRGLYYETNLKVKALPASKDIYTGQKDIQIATPIFSKESSSTKVIYLKDDKGQIETNNYGDIQGNAHDPESGNLVINIPASVTPGKHILTFEAYAPNGYISSKASITVNIKTGIESLSMIKSLSTYYLGNKDINIKPTTRYYNITHAPMYESVTKPSTCKAVYRVESDNEYLLPYITINPANGNVKISKNLSKVYDRIKPMGTSFRIIATANDYPGTEVYKSNSDRLSREDKWQIEITTDGISDYLKNNNEVRAFLEYKYYDERGKLQVSEKPTDVAIIDKNNKKRSQFTVQQANNLTFKVYRSATDTDDKNIHTNISWKVSGPVQSYRADNYGLHIDKVKPGIITVTATAADGSGNGSVTRTFEVKKDDYKLRLVDHAYGNKIIPYDASTYYDNENYAIQGVQYRILPFNDEETEPIIEEPFQDHIDDIEHNYKVNISGGIILNMKSDVVIWVPTEQYTKITVVNNNKGSDGKKVQEDKVYTIHNTCFDKTEPVFDKVKVLPAKTLANKYYDGKEAAKIRFEVTNLPASVADKGDGHTGYFLTLAKNYKEKTKYPEPELDAMIAEVPMSSEIMHENGKYYVEIHQNIGEEWWQEPSDWVPGTYNLEAFIGKGDITEENIQYVLNKKPIETTLTITPNNLKATWEGGNTTKIKIKGNEKDKQVHLVVSANSIDRDTEYFKWTKNKNVSEVKLTGIEYDLDTLNIFKEGLISEGKLFVTSSEDGNIDFTYKAEDFDALKNAVVNAARGKSVVMGSSAQKSAAKMTAKPDKSGNYDMNKVNPVIRGRITYEIIGTDALGYDKISNLTQNFEITLVNP